MKKQVKKCVVRDYVKRTPKKIIKDTILTTLRNAAKEAQVKKEAEIEKKEEATEEKKAVRRQKKTADEQPL